MIHILKKVLALVLVVATLMGFATVASAQYTDDNSIKYKEAVEVMSMINVINGYTDGSFRPEANVTRAQMAKMVSYIVAGGEDVGDLYAGANTFVDCTNHWARGYIAYASKTGFVAGVGNNKFNPEGSVTGVQAAKMLLCALGYDANVEQYVGTNWAVNTLSDARAAGLLDGLTKVDMNSALSREAAAQMMFNALKADVVEYENKGSSIDLGNGSSINIGATSAKTVTTKDKVGGNMGDAKLEDNSYTLQLAEKYFEDLKLDSAASDEEAFARPSHSWKYGKESVGPFADEATFTYTSFTKGSDLTKDLKGYKYGDADNKGVDAKGYNFKATKVTKAADLEPLTGNGTIVEIYANDEDIVTDIIVIAPKAGTVTVKEVKETKSHGAYTEYSIVGGPSGKIYSTIVDDEKDSAFVTGDIENKDLVTYYVDSNKNLYITETTELTGVLTAVSSDNTLTIDGEKYGVSSAAAGEKFTPSKNEQTFAVDAYGYIVKATEAATETRYGLVLENATYSHLTDEGKIETVYAVTLATADGKVETATVDETVINEFKDKYEGEVVSYTVNSKGVYQLTPVGSNDNKVVNITNGNSQMDGTGSKKIFASTNTLFVFADYKKDDGKTEIAGTVTTYTGYKNVPSYKDLKEAWAIDTDDDTIADVVFVYDNKSAAADDSYVYVKGTYSNTADGWAYDVIIKGEDSTIVLNEKDAGLTAGMYSKVVVADGKVVWGPDDTHTASTSYKAVKNNGGVLSVGQKDDSLKALANVADDAPVYYIDTTENTAGTTGAASDLTDVVTGDQVFVVMNDAEDAVVAIYILSE